MIIKTEEEGETISKIMQIIKSEFAKEYNRINSRIGPFWNERFGDKIIEHSNEPGEYMIHLLWYISYNSCRKGYVHDPRDYEFCPLCYYLNGQQNKYIDISYSSYFKQLGENFSERSKIFEEYESEYRQFL